MSLAAGKVFSRGMIGLSFAAAQGLFVFLAAPKILPLGKLQASLLLPSLIRIFDFVEDTSPQQNPNKFGFVFGLFVSLAAPKRLRLGIIKLSLASALDFSYL